MSKRYGMFRLTDIFANELDRIAGSDVLVDITAAINSFRRFAFELSDPGWIGSHTIFCEQGQRVGPLPPLSRFWRRSRPVQQERMDCRERDQGPGHERAGESVKVPAHHRAALEVGNHGGHQPNQERCPNCRALQQPLDDGVFVHVTTAGAAARQSPTETAGKTKGSARLSNGSLSGGGLLRRICPLVTHSGHSVCTAHVRFRGKADKVSGLSCGPPSFLCKYTAPLLPPRRRSNRLRGLFEPLARRCVDQRTDDP